MSRIVVVQHSAYEPLGIIINTLKENKLRLKYVNFQRDPDQKVEIKDYHSGLIVLGGNMNPDELDTYPHLKHEIELIQEALAKDIPVLGICLGSQLLNMALGGDCYSLKQAEFGWQSIEKLQEHPAFADFPKQMPVFQWHQYASRLPKQVDLILGNDSCAQAFSYQNKAIGVQFHLEVDKLLLNRWLAHPDYLSHLESHIGQAAIKKIHDDTRENLIHSIQTGEKFFSRFTRLFVKKKVALGSRHAGR